jgi:hypothetical protein
MRLDVCGGLQRLAGQCPIDGLAERHGGGPRRGLVGAGAGGLERRLDVETVDLEGCRDLLGDELEGDLLGGTR